MTALRQTTPVSLLCCAHSGGSASFYRPLAAIDVAGPVPLLVNPLQYPGREDRIDDPLPRQLTDLADEVATTALRHREPVVLFGHSMGAAVAFEAAIALTAAGVAPRALVVSGRTPPMYPIRSRMHAEPGVRMWQRLSALGGLHPEILHNDDLRELLDPIVREDLRVSETYCYRGRLPVLDCPVLAASGRDDPVASGTAMQDWNHVTSGPVRRRVFDGDHFYVKPAGEQLLAWISDELSTLGAEPSTAADHA
ncbi:thioesterase II family protein [Microlunatus soli]|uniref:Thioesterase domain-containing protein n=1 Tax=Microlunatus soli TaxID=630515 RepID=A0A1H1VW01_9ACTN|nr:alpha/beta fold hydrolase [Microlunatus soli]SDS88219.1 Thioesterase domain-containing protein [Microlunatus soli]